MEINTNSYTQNKPTVAKRRLKLQRTELSEFQVEESASPANSPVSLVAPNSTGRDRSEQENTSKLDGLLRDVEFFAVEDSGSPIEQQSDIGHQLVKQNDQEISSLRSEISRLKEQNEELTRSREALEVELLESLNSQEDAEAKLEIGEKKVKDMEARIDSLEKDLPSEKDAWIRKVEYLEGILIDISKQIDIGTAMLSENQENSFADYDSVKKGISRVFSDLNSKVTAQDQELSSLNSELETSKSSLAENMELIQELKEQIERQNKQMEKSAQSFQAELSDKIAQIKHLEHDVEYLHSKIEKLEEENSNLSLKHEKLDVKNVEEIRQLELKIEALITEKEELDAKIQNSDAEAEEIDALHMKFENLTEEISQLKFEYEKSNDRISELEGENKHLKNELDRHNLNNDSDRYMVSVSLSANEESEEVEKERGQIARSSSIDSASQSSYLNMVSGSLKNMDFEVPDYNVIKIPDDASLLQRHIKELLCIIKIAKQELEKLRKESDTMKKESANLKNSIEQDRAKSSRSISEWEEWAQKVEQQYAHDIEEYNKLINTLKEELAEAKKLAKEMKEKAVDIRQHRKALVEDFLNEAQTRVEVINSLLNTLESYDNDFS